MSGDPQPKSNREWIYWGDSDPFYGVLSVPGKNTRDADPWKEEEFYAQAIPEFAVNLRHWESYGLVPEACVEIGCGAGRMTRRLQTVFATVHACDVAPGMLELVRRNCDPAIVLAHQCNGSDLPLPDESVTAAYSTIVFQHFDSPAIGREYFREIHRVMKSGGTLPDCNLGGKRLRCGRPAREAIGDRPGAPCHEDSGGPTAGRVHGRYLVRL
jgi:SAM-dependent methyltransferase